MQRLIHDSGRDVLPSNPHFEQHYGHIFILCSFAYGAATGKSR